MERADFDKAHAFTAKWEGGLVDHPADPGGITNHGVSLRFLKEQGIDIDNDGDIDADDIRGLTKAQAKDLFKRFFWKPMQCDLLPLRTATALYDSGVNMGISRAITFLQRAVNEMSDSQQMGIYLEADGKIGPRTRNSAVDMGRLGYDMSIAASILYQRNKFYTELAERRPEMRVFLRGWLNRVSALSDYINT